MYVVPSVAYKRKINNLEHSEKRSYKVNLYDDETGAIRIRFGKVDSRLIVGYVEALDGCTCYRSKDTDSGSNGSNCLHFKETADSIVRYGD
jgi:hypothetical protein